MQTKLSCILDPVEHDQRRYRNRASKLGAPGLLQLDLEHVEFRLIGYALVVKGIGPWQRFRH